MAAYIYVLLHSFHVRGQIPCSHQHTCHLITCTCTSHVVKSLNRAKCSNFLSATKGSRDGAVLRGLASHQCGLGLIWPNSYHFLLCALLQGLSPGFLPPEKPTFPISNAIRIEDQYEEVASFLNIII